MAKTLQLQFLNQENKVVTVAIENPTEPVDNVALHAAMDAIITANVFSTSGGDIVSKHGARIVERNVADLIL